MRELVLEGLTRRQAQVLWYILLCWSKGYLPTFRELMRVFGMSSPKALGEG